MSNKVELTEEQIEEMNDILVSLGRQIEGEQQDLEEVINLVGSVGSGTLDSKIYELLEQKEENLKIQYNTVAEYTRLWQDIVNKYTDIESDLIEKFTNGSIK